MMFFYRPNGGLWMIFRNRPLVAIDWMCGWTIRFNLRTRVALRA